VYIALDLDARDHALRDGYALAALRIAYHRDLVLQARHAAKLQRLHALPEMLVSHAQEG